MRSRYKSQKQWLLGTQSPMLSFMLSSFREPKLKSLEAPALMPEATLKAHGMMPLQSRFHPLCSSNALVWMNFVAKAEYQTDGCLRCKFSQKALNPLRFTEDEADLITDPCPLIFAVETQTFGTKTNVSYDLGNPLEIQCGPYSRPNNLIFVMEVDRAVLLGREIKWIYTSGQDVPRVQRALGSLNGQVQVLDFSKIPYQVEPDLEGA